MESGDGLPTTTSHCNRLVSATHASILVELNHTDSDGIGRFSHRPINGTLNAIHDCG
jgi:hypothetical protein